MRLAFKNTVAAWAVAALLVGSGTASADALLSTADGNVTVGVNELGSLFNGDGGPMTGINYAGVGDALTPGCLCEGWGVSYGAANTGNVYAGSPTNVDFVSFVTDGSTFATSVTTMDSLTVTQAYARPAGSGALIENTVTITNTGAVALTDVRYARNMDWDVPPTTFSEMVTIQRGGSTALLHSTNDGFSASNPLAPPGTLCGAPANSDYVDFGPCDHGAWFSFGFGTLDPGESITFSIFYGATANEALAIAALAGVAAEVYSLGQNSRTPSVGDPATYIFGFAGVGGTPVTAPEPALMLLTGIAAAGAAYRRRRKA